MPSSHRIYTRCQSARNDRDIPYWSGNLGEKDPTILPSVDCPPLIVYITGAKAPETAEIFHTGQEMLGNRTRQSFQAWIAPLPSYIYPVPKRQKRPRYSILVREFGGKGPDNPSKRGLSPSHRIYNRCQSARNGRDIPYWSGNVGEQDPTILPSVDCPPPIVYIPGAKAPETTEISHTGQGMLGNRNRRSFQEAWIATLPSYIYPIPKRQDVCRQDPTILPRYGPSKTKPLPSYMGSSSTTDRYLWFSKPATSKCSNFGFFLVLSSDRGNFSKGTSRSIGQ